MIGEAEQELAREALRESEERLRLAVEVAGFGIYYCDLRKGSAWWSHELYSLNRHYPGPAVFEEEFRVVRADTGAMRWLRVRGRTRSGAEGGRPVTLAHTGIVLDVTERKQMEESLRLADWQKSEFLAAIARELRDPLTPIRNAAEVLHRLLGSHAVGASSRCAMIIVAIEWATTRRLQEVGWRRKESRPALHTMFRDFTGLGAPGQKGIMDM